MDAAVLDRYHLVCSFPILEKVVERMLGFSVCSRWANFLRPFLSGLWPGYRTETTLVALLDDLQQILDEESLPLFILLDVSVYLLPLIPQKIENKDSFF